MGRGCDGAGTVIQRIQSIVAFIPSAFRLEIDVALMLFVRLAVLADVVGVIRQIIRRDKGNGFDGHGFPGHHDLQGVFPCLQLNRREFVLQAPAHGIGVEDARLLLGGTTLIAGAVHNGIAVAGPDTLERNHIQRIGQIGAVDLQIQLNVVGLAFQRQIMDAHIVLPRLGDGKSPLGRALFRHIQCGYLPVIVFIASHRGRGIRIRYKAIRGLENNVVVRVASGRTAPFRGGRHPLRRRISNGQLGEQQQRRRQYGYQFHKHTAPFLEKWVLPRYQTVRPAN